MKAPPGMIQYVIEAYERERRRARLEKFLEKPETCILMERSENEWNN